MSDNYNDLFPDDDEFDNFGEDDLFEDNFGFDDFDNQPGGDDDLFGDDPLSSLEDEPGGADDFDFDSGLDFEGFDTPGTGEDFEFEEQFEQEEAAAEGGGNNLFYILAGVLVFILLLGFGLIAFLALRPDPEQIALQETTTFIETENAAVATFQVETQTQSALDMQETATESFLATQDAGTEVAIAATETAALEGDSATATAEQQASIASATAAAEATVVQADVFASATVVALTEGPVAEATDEPLSTPTGGSGQSNIFASATAVALTQAGSETGATPEKVESPTPEVLATDDTGGVGGQVETEEATATEETMPPTATDGGISLPAVQQTATALAELFNATPTQETGITPQTTVVATTIPGATAIPTTVPGSEQLPDTGLFDDVFQGNPLSIFLLAVGLLGVIAISRGLRSVNRDRGE
ncbi:MAG: hypothetical protein KC496_07600 [Anaerolineae bacterium]|nr:hypothetical protein [Anaerolineae bacterium]